MAVIFYNIFLWLFRAGTGIASVFNPKAKKWVSGRKNIFDRLTAAIPPGEKVIWMHCASLGEFEQGRPVLEALKEIYPDHRRLLTFFSPSGYEVQKNYPGADWVFYLPIDGPVHARRFLEVVHPSLVIFVKYEFWYYYLKKIKYRDIPLILISALFRPDMSFFKWYGGLQRKMLSRFNHLFVQNESSKNLVEKIGVGDICTVSGDTRFDRVARIAATAGPLPLIEKFIGSSKTLVAGSTWPEDEKILQETMNGLGDPSFKLIIAPHEIREKNLEELTTLFPGSVRYSQLVEMEREGSTLPYTSTLVIDNIGLLSRLYKYAFITYIGGGFHQNGIHNVLEAAVFDKIVLFGPYYKKYSEAIGLVKSAGGISFTTSAELQELVKRFQNDQQEYMKRSKASGEFVRSQVGATQKIIRYIQEKRLLTN